MCWPPVFHGVSWAHSANTHHEIPPASGIWLSNLQTFFPEGKWRLPVSRRHRGVRAPAFVQQVLRTLCLHSPLRCAARDGEGTAESGSEGVNVLWVIDIAVPEIDSRKVTQAILSEATVILFEGGSVILDVWEHMLSMLWSWMVTCSVLPTLVGGGRPNHRRRNKICFGGGPLSVTSLHTHVTLLQCMLYICV